MSILTANGQQCNEKDLIRDFREFGFNIFADCRSHGFTNLKDLLKYRMSDVCFVHDIPFSNEYIVKKKVSEDSRHMDNFTISQNAKKRAKKSAKRYSGVM